MIFAAAATAAAFLSSVVASASSVDGAGGASSTSAMRGMASIKGLLDKNNLPTTGQDWISLGDKSAFGLEYQPNDFDDEDPATARRLRAIRDRTLLSWGTKDYSNQFIDGGETYYDEYSQAWRLLGFYIDCDSPYEREGDCDGGGGGGNDNDEGENCPRYLLWAAVSKEKNAFHSVLRLQVAYMYVCMGSARRPTLVSCIFLTFVRYMYLIFQPSSSTSYFAVHRP